VGVVLESANVENDEEDPDDEEINEGILEGDAIVDPFFNFFLLLRLIKLFMIKTSNENNILWYPILT
jgi:hypothetical protein